MTAMVIAERLKVLREHQRLTKKQLAERTAEAYRKNSATAQGLTKTQLAGRASTVSAKTISRIERGEWAPRRGTIKGLADALNVDPDVLTGEKPMPAQLTPVAGRLEDSVYQVNVRVNPAIRNAYELAARRYRVSVSKIGQLAPLLFAIIAEASLRNRSENVNECLDKYTEYCEAKERIPYHIPVYELAEEIHVEEESIRNKEIFGQSLLDRSANPFETHVATLAAKYMPNDAAVYDVGPASTDYRLCRETALALVGGDQDLAASLLNGEVMIHRMPRGLTQEQRIQWIRDNPVQEIDEQVEEEIPEEIYVQSPAEAIDL